MKAIEFFHPGYDTNNQMSRANATDSEGNQYSGLFKCSSSEDGRKFIKFELDGAKGDEKYELSARNTSLFSNTKFSINEPSRTIEIPSVSTCNLKCRVIFPDRDTSTSSRENKTNGAVEELLIYCKNNPETLMKFKCHDDDVFVPTILMCARSTNIDGLMNSDATEAKTKTVEIVDYSLEIVKKMVEFVETNNVQVTETYEIELLKIVNQYGIDSMIEFISKLMIDSLNFKNVLEFYQFAFNHFNIDLKEACITFASRNINNIFQNLDLNNIDGELFKQFTIEVQNKLKNQ